MKKLTLLIFVFLSFMVNAQVNTLYTETEYHNEDFEIYIYGNNLDSGVVYSDWFDLTEFNGNSFASYPLTYAYTVDSLSGGDAIYSIYVERYLNGLGTEIIDTIATVDTTVGATGAVNSGTIDLNNKKAYEYRIKVENTSTLTYKYRLNLFLLATKRDN